MDQQEALEEAELGKGVVAGKHGLDPLLAGDTDSNMRTCRKKKTQTNRCSSKRFISNYSNLLRSLCVLTMPTTGPQFLLTTIK